MQQPVLYFILLLSFTTAFGQALPDRPTTETFFTVQADGSERVSSRTVFVYDQQGRLTRSRTESPLDHKLYTSHLLATYTYDSRDSLMGFVLEGTSKPNGNAVRNQFTFTRDEQGNKVSEEGSTWDFERKAWRKTQRTLQTFDGQNRLTTSKFSNYDQATQTWGSPSVATYSYGNRQQIVESAGQRVSTVYDERDRVVRIITELLEKGQWVLQHLTTTDYETMTSVSQQYCRPKISQPYSVVKTQLNAQNKPARVDFRLDQSVYRLLSVPIDSLTNRSYNGYAYDASGRLTEKVNWEYPIGTTTTRRTGGVRYTYNDPQPEEASLMVYPNPTTGVVNLLNEGSCGCVERYEVATPSGQIVQQGKALVNLKLADTPECSPKINLTTLPDGPYVIRLYLGNSTTVSHRVLKKREPVAGK